MQETSSLSSLLKTATPQAIRETVDKLDADAVIKLLYDWHLYARPAQIIPKQLFTYWIILAGRGFGKTRTGAETVRIWKDNNPIILLVGATAGDVRDIMIEGESGILNTSPEWDYPLYEPSKLRLTWNNGAQAIIRSAEEPERFRGLQFHKGWLDELASWKYPGEAWDQVQMGLRLGDNPQLLITTTPRPIKTLKNILNHENTVVTTGSTYENKDNLAAAFFDSIIKKYEGTRLGRQELLAELIEDVEGALWNRGLLDKNRTKELPELIEVVIAIDPAVTATDKSDETGIVVAGKDSNGAIYIIDDVSGTYSPAAMMRVAITAYDKHKADMIVAEVNNGGDFIENALRQIDSNVPYKKVHASRGKVARAQPVVLAYERGQIKHLGDLAKLEDEMTTWDEKGGQKSPNRIDALVWAVTYLINNKDKSFWVV